MHCNISIILTLYPGKGWLVSEKYPLKNVLELVFHNKPSSQFSARRQDDLGEFQLLFAAQALQNRHILEHSQEQPHEVGTLFVPQMEKRVKIQRWRRWIVFHKECNHSYITRDLRFFHES